MSDDFLVSSFQHDLELDLDLSDDKFEKVKFLMYDSSLVFSQFGKCLCGGTVFQTL